MAGLSGTEWWLSAALAPLAGSFLGVVITRLPEGETVVAGRSRCRQCSHALGVLDLVPIISWLASNGRCRYCAAAIPSFYPLIEVAAIIVALWAGAVVSGWLVWTSCALGWALLSLAVIDQRHQRLPDALTLPLIPAGLAVAWGIDADLLADHALGALAGFAVFFTIAAAYRRLRGQEGLGLGDAKLLAAGGAWLAWQGLPSVVLIAAVIALAIALAQSLGRRRLQAQERLAFGPYLAIAIWLVWLYGPLGFG
jgi:leader peptidase (prepilin peptidase)/N-methyltransferase